MEGPTRASVLNYQPGCVCWLTWTWQQFIPAIWSWHKQWQLSIWDVSCPPNVTRKLLCSDFEEFWHSLMEQILSLLANQWTKYRSSYIRGCIPPSATNPTATFISPFLLPMCSTLIFLFLCMRLVLNSIHQYYFCPNWFTCTVVLHVFHYECLMEQLEYCCNCSFGNRCQHYSGPQSIDDYLQGE